MTWNSKDLGKPTATADPLAPPAGGIPGQAPAPTPEATPRVALAAFLADAPAADWTPSPEQRRELTQAGLIDDATWAAYRRLLTRGLIAE
jgi:hypothetical protein